MSFKYLHCFQDMIIGQLPDVERKGEEKDSKRARLEVEEDPTENTQKKGKGRSRTRKCSISGTS